MSLKALTARLDKVAPPPVDPERCPGGPTGWRVFVQERAGERRLRHEPDADPVPCRRCGRPHVVDLVERVVERGPDGGLVFAGDGSPVEADGDGP